MPLRDTLSRLERKIKAEEEQLSSLPTQMEDAEAHYIVLMKAISSALSGFDIEIEKRRIVIRDRKERSYSAEALSLYCYGLHILIEPSNEFVLGRALRAGMYIRGQEHRSAIFRRNNENSDWIVQFSLHAIPHAVDVEKTVTAESIEEALDFVLTPETT